MIINQQNMAFSNQLCPICGKPVPVWRLDLGLCLQHSKQFNQRNWGRARQSKQPLKVSEYIVSFHHKQQWTLERKREVGRNSMRRQYAANPDKFRQRSRKWYRDNSGTCCAYQQSYYQLHLNQAKQYNRKRSINRGIGGGVCTLDTWAARVEFYGWKCFYCNITLTEDTLTADHRIPVSKGGTNWPSNLVPACKACNCGKRDKIYYDTQRRNVSA